MMLVGLVEFVFFNDLLAVGMTFSVLDERKFISGITQHVDMWIDVLLLIFVAFEQLGCQITGFAKPTPCINNIQHFNNQLMHTTLKNVELLKHLKISNTAPTCFGLQGNHH